LIKKVKGDQTVFLEELMAVLKITDQEKNIQMRAGGTTIEVNGNHVRELRLWLAGLGF